MRRMKSDPLNLLLVAAVSVLFFKVFVVDLLLRTTKVSESPELLSKLAKLSEDSVRLQIQQSQMERMQHSLAASQKGLSQELQNLETPSNSPKLEQLRSELSASLSQMRESLSGRLARQETDLLRRIQQVEHLALKPALPKKQKVSGPQNIMYIKVPKTGSTMLQRVLYTAAIKHYNFSVPFIDPALHEQLPTCWEDNPEQAWQSFVAGNGGTLDLFGLHACFLPSMIEPQNWSLHRKPFLVTMVRRPLDHFMSSYRYVKLCCREKLEWCSHLCGDLQMEKFMERYCWGDYCNQQTLYIAGAAGDANSALDKFDHVFVVERFMESLAIFALKLDLPPHLLYHIQENTNVKVIKRMNGTGTSPEVERAFLSKQLGKDAANYELASQRLDSEIARLSPEDHVRYLKLIGEVEYGNERLAKKCVPRCRYNGYSFNVCMKGCWGAELRRMAIQFNWPEEYGDIGFVYQIE